MRPDLARQAEQPQRIVEVEILRRYVLGDRRPLRLLPVAKLDIGAETPAALRHPPPGFGIAAHRPGAGVDAIPCPARLRALAGLFAGGIMSARDERPALSTRQPQHP